jgi:hypothetical protein
LFGSIDFLDKYNYDKISPGKNSKDVSMATVEELQAEITELKEQVTMLKRLMGDTTGSLGRLNVGTDKLLGPFSSLVDATSSGATGLGIYNETLAKGDEALKAFGGLLGTYGATLTALTGASASYMQAVTKQTDEQYKAYQGLAAAGAGFQEKTNEFNKPVKGTFESINDLANQFGIVNSRDLPKFVQIISQSSETLAKFGGTVYDGMKAFGSLANSVQNTGLQTEFLNMGMTVDSINKGLAGYLKTQTLSAAGQMKSQQELNAGAADYIRNLDMLSKLTGKSVEVLQKEQDEALLNEQYSIHQRELQQKADAGDIEAQKQLVEEQKVISQTEGSVRKGFMAAFTGMGMQFEEGRKLYQSAPEAFNQAAKGTGVQANQILDSAKSEFKKTMDTFGGLIMATGNTLFASVSDMRKIENLQGTAEERATRTKELQDRTKTATDEGVAGMTALSQEQRNAARDLNQFVQIGVLPSIYFLGKLAEKTREMADLLPGAKPRTTEQQTGQGYGSNVGQPGVSGRTSADIERSAKQSVGKDIEDYKKKLSALNTQLSGIGDQSSEAYKTLKEQIEKLTKMKEALEKFVGVAPPPAPGPGPGPQPAPSPQVPIPAVTPRPVSSPQVPIPAVIPRPVSSNYNEDLNSAVAKNDQAKTEEMKTAMKSFEGSSPQKTTNEEVVASNTMLAGKMDDLIDLMRKSVGYQEKISNQAYA